MENTVDPDRARELLTGELAALDERLRVAEDNRAEAAPDPNGPDGAIGQHPGDHGSDVTATMEARMTVETIAEQRRRVRDALERLDGGDYGRCAVCDREIDDERLESRPEVRTCREHADTPVVT
ncbi:MAG TPA: TraR/DksA C4-type zinc finger protein [Pseudonocardia sp.]|mgnify:CR=1 FL=1|jgi:DnaK suppressor protein|uniref:TraR/DksA family transcriptional regulator n=1 Tax=Pseudonocardia sp. TaxID=60912 RepID=UPI002B4B3BF2|nr:TraR/DksA C4-type zinc finger protein [Pseudonocardia sp.]HLU57895.1 TraR/DksA C4-type zinc finger protein [Pseudonocardia sp.]